MDSTHNLELVLMLVSGIPVSYTLTTWCAHPEQFVLVMKKYAKHFLVDSVSGIAW